MGYGPAFHLMEIENQLQQVKRSAKVVNIEDPKERQQKLRELFAGYEVVLEQPASICLPDLLDMYPNAKVIMTPVEWLKWLP
jgi:hypothetical protein